MEEQKSSDLGNKVGTFVSTAVTRIINLVMILVIIALVALVAWFWHNNQLLEQKVEGLQDEIEKFEKISLDSGDRDVVMKKEVEKIESSVENEKELSAEKNSEYQKNNEPTNESNNLTESVLPEGSFKKVDYGYEGDFYIKGYAKVENRETLARTIQEEAIFYVTDYGNANEFKAKFGFDESYNKNYGYVLGCVNKNTTIYNSGKNGENFYSKDLTDKILNSSEDKQIILHVETYSLETGGGAPECYSKFEKVEIYQE